MERQMILLCPQCATRYIVPDSAIGPAGRQVRCAACRHSWFQDGAEMRRPDLTPEPTPAAAPEPALAAAGTPVTSTVPDQTGAPVAASSGPSSPASPPAPAPIAPAASPQMPFEREEAALPEPASAGQAAPRHDPVAPAPSAAAPAEFVHYPDDDYEAPVKRRRNPARLWTIAAIIFFLVVSAAGGALAYFGTPSWAVNLGLSARNDETGLNFYLPKPPERRNLPTGEEYFAFSARILNDSDHELTVPPVVVELRDDQGRLVFSWMTKADKARLKPNEEARVSESRLDIPKNARNLELRFVDSAS
jgi:predicted Zn finger-like uncharacterized protein